MRGKRARSVVIAPNIESVSADGGLDDHLKEIISMCSEQGVSVVFALTRKKMGELYGYRKRVSAVAVLEFNGADGLHVHMLQLAVAGRREWEVGDGCRHCSLRWAKPVFLCSRATCALLALMWPCAALLRCLGVFLKLYLTMCVHDHGATVFRKPTGKGCCLCQSSRCEVEQGHCTSPHSITS